MPQGMNTSNTDEAREEHPTGQEHTMPGCSCWRALPACRQMRRWPLGGAQLLACELFGQLWTACQAHCQEKQSLSDRLCGTSRCGSCATAGAQLSYSSRPEHARPSDRAQEPGLGEAPAHAAPGQGSLMLLAEPGWQFGMAGQLQAGSSGHPGDSYVSPFMRASQAPQLSRGSSPERDAAHLVPPGTDKLSLSVKLVRSGARAGAQPAARRGGCADATPEREWHFDCPPLPCLRGPRLSPGCWPGQITAQPLPAHRLQRIRSSACCAPAGAPGGQPRLPVPAWQPGPGAGVRLAASPAPQHACGRRPCRCAPTAVARQASPAAWRLSSARRPDRLPPVQVWTSRLGRKWSGVSRSQANVTVLDTHRNAYSVDDPSLQDLRDQRCPRCAPAVTD